MQKRIGIFGYLVSIFVSVLVTLIIVQTIVVDQMQEGCDRRQPIFEEIARTVEDAAKNSESNAEAAAYRARADEIRERIVTDCNSAYPSIIPFVD